MIMSPSHISSRIDPGGGGGESAAVGHWRTILRTRHTLWAGWRPAPEAVYRRLFNRFGAIPPQRVMLTFSQEKKKKKKKKRNIDSNFHEWPGDRRQKMRDIRRPDRQARGPGSTIGLGTAHSNLRSMSANPDISIWQKYGRCTVHSGRRTASHANGARVPARLAD